MKYDTSLMVPVVGAPYPPEVREAISQIVREFAPTELTFRANDRKDHFTVIGYLKALDWPVVTRQVFLGDRSTAHA